MRYYCCWWWWNVLSVGGCAAKHIEGCVVGVMKPQELLYAAVDYYIKILIRPSKRQPTKTPPPPRANGRRCALRAACCVLSVASARCRASAAQRSSNLYKMVAYAGNTLWHLEMFLCEDFHQVKHSWPNSVTHLMQQNMKSL